MKLSTLLAVMALTVGAELRAVDISGTVADADGRTLAGARVSIDSADPKTGIIPICRSCYPDCRKSAVTDAPGHFTIAEVNPALQFWLLVIADERKPRFVGPVDPAAGPVKITVQPRNLSAVPAERLLTGHVLGPDGSPLPGATVNPVALGFRYQHLSASSDQLDPLSVTNERGEFFIETKEPEKLVSVVVGARGMAPKVFEELAADGHPHELQLSSGALVEGRLLAPGGHGAAHVKVGLVQTQRNSNEHYLGNFEAETDADGHFAFANVPPSRAYFVYPLAESVGPLGWAMAPQTISVGGDETVAKVGEVTLLSATRLAGQIVLSDGHAVPPGCRVVVTREPSDSQVIDLDAEGRFTVCGLPKDKLTVTVAVKGYKVSWKNKDIDEPNRRIFVQIGESDGARKLLLDAEAKPVAETASARVRIHGIVLLPDGQPASGVQIALATRQNAVTIYDGKVQPNPSAPPSLKTGADGRFTLANPPSPCVLVVVCAQGYVEVRVDEVHPTMAITLQPWSRIEGYAKAGGKPVRYNTVEGFYMSHRTYDPALPQVDFQFRSKTDGNGRYTIESAPEGIISLGRQAEVEHYWGRCVQLLNVQTKGGETAMLDLGGSGRLVTGTVIIPPEVVDQVDWEGAAGEFCSEQKEVSVPAGLNTEERLAWARADETSEAARNELLADRSYFFRVAQDGAFRIEDVAPGKYTLFVRLPRKGENRGEEVGHARTNVTLAADPARERAGEAVDAGKIPLELEVKGFVRGEAAPPFEFTALDGHVINTDACKGKVVLLHFWKASTLNLDWDVKLLRDLHETFAEDPRFVIVSLAMNEERKELEQFVESHPLPWPQVFVGDLEKSPITKSFRVRGWPSVFLIGPDGKFIEPLASLSGLKPSIAKALEP